MAGRGCMVGAPPPPAVRTLVFELSNPCQCFGCRQKITTALNRLQGVVEHCYNLEKNQVIVTGTMDPVTVIRKLSSVKKHAVLVHHGITAGPPQQLPARPCHCQGQSAHPAPPCSAGHHGPPPPPPRPNNYPVHVHSDEPPLQSSACRCPPPPPHIHPSEPRPPHYSSSCHHPPHYNCTKAPLLPTKIINSIQPPPSSSACHHPPPPPHPHGCGHAPAPHQPPPPHNPPHTGILGQLANIKRLRHVDVIKKMGIKVTFEDDGHHPTSCRQTSDSVPFLPQQQPPPHLSPFTD